MTSTIGRIATWLDARPGSVAIWWLMWLFFQLLVDGPLGFVVLDAFLLGSYFRKWMES